MEKYSVCLTEEVFYNVEVEAESLMQAISNARKLVESGEIDGEFADGFKDITVNKTEKKPMTFQDDELMTEALLCFNKWVLDDKPHSHEVECDYQRAIGALTWTKEQGREWMQDFINDMEKKNQ